MKRRLNLACGVLHEPKLVLLDEPTVGVDPQSREKIYDMLGGLRAAGASLLLTTHYLEEAEARCERIVIVDRGRAIAAGTLSELVEQAGLSGRRVRLSLEQPLAGGASPGAHGASTHDAGVPAGFTRGEEANVLTATITDVAHELPGLLSRLQSAGLGVRDLEVRSASLQVVFLALTGKELRE